jgi:uncharacterized protein
VSRGAAGYLPGVLFAVIIAVASIALGAVLGLLPGNSSRAASPFQTFAMVTAVAVVLGQLLPDALAAVGVLALLAFAAGFALPRIAERIALRMRAPACSHDDAMCTDLGLEIGYVGLLLHHLGDGVGLGLYSGPLHAGHEHYDVLVALAAHTVPISALMVLAFKTHRGTLNAALRAAGIAASLLAGVALANLFSAAQLAAFEPWLTALVSGLLLHVVAHGWPEELRATRSSRLMDFGAIAAGLAIVLLGGHSHAAEHGRTDLRHAMGEALVELGLETAPMLLLGLIVAAVLQTQGARIPLRWLQQGGAFTQATRGALIGVPLPVCACGVLPVAHSLKQRGGAAAMVVAFLIATPELGVETFALTVQFLGWPFAYFRLLGAFVLSISVGLLIARFVPVNAPADEPSHTHEDPASEHVGGHGHGHAHGHEHEHGSASGAVSAATTERGLGVQIAKNFDELLYHIGAWTLIGLIAAAYLQAALTDGALTALASSGFDMVLVSLLAIPSYVCASSATPLAAVLLAKGVSPGAVLIGLLLGPATNIATIAWLRKAYGARATLYAMAGLLAVSWTLGLVLNRIMPSAGIEGAVEAVAAHGHGPVHYASLTLLLLLLARAVWRSGLRSWLGSLGEALALGPDPHLHAHAHAHARVPDSERP